MIYVDTVLKLLSYYTLCLYYNDFGVEALEVVFLLCVLSINFGGACRESGIVAVERDCAFVYVINGKSSERLWQSVCKGKILHGLNFFM